MGWWRAIVALGGSGMDVSVFLLKSLGLDPLLWLFLRVYSLASFLLMNNGTLKVQVSNFPPYCINNFPTPLLLRSHPRQYSFRCVIYKVFILWRDMYWYCILVFLWVCWRWFGTLWLWKLLPNFLLKIGSIME